MLTEAQKQLASYTEAQLQSLDNANLLNHYSMLQALFYLKADNADEMILTTKAITLARGEVFRRMVKSPINRGEEAPENKQS